MDDTQADAFMAEFQALAGKYGLEGAFFVADTGDSYMSIMNGTLPQLLEMSCAGAARLYSEGQKQMQAAAEMAKRPLVVLAGNGTVN